jgi:hypothetical protein
MKNGYRVVDIDTHVNPSFETLAKYVDPGFRPRLDELTPYLRVVDHVSGRFTNLAVAPVPFDRFPGQAPAGEHGGAVAGGRGALEGRVTKSSSHHRVAPRPGVQDEDAAARIQDMDLAYGRWREYDAEDTMRFYALRLHEAGMIKANPNKLIA